MRLEHYAAEMPEEDRAYALKRWVGVLAKLREAADRTAAPEEEAGKDVDADKVRWQAPENSHARVSMPLWLWRRR